MERRLDAVRGLRPRRGARRRARLFGPGDERDRAQYRAPRGVAARDRDEQHRLAIGVGDRPRGGRAHLCRARSEEHTSELQSLMRISYAVFCLKKKKKKKHTEKLK